MPGPIARSDFGVERSSPGTAQMMPDWALRERRPSPQEARMKHEVAMVAASILAMATHASAQPVIDQRGGPLSPKAPVVQRAREFRSTELIGGVVYNRQDERLGVIDDVVIGPKGQVNAVVLATGGFLGLGQREVAILYSSLEPNREGGRVRFTVNTEPEILDRLPAYRDY